MLKKQSAKKINTKKTQALKAAIINDNVINDLSIVKVQDNNKKQKALIDGDITEAKQIINQSKIKKTNAKKMNKKSKKDQALKSAIINDNVINDLSIVKVQDNNKKQKSLINGDIAEAKQIIHQYKDNNSKKNLERLKSLMKDIKAVKNNKARNELFKKWAENSKENKILAANIFDALKGKKDLYSVIIQYIYNDENIDVKACKESQKEINGFIKAINSKKENVKKVKKSLYIDVAIDLYDGKMSVEDVAKKYNKTTKQIKDILNKTIKKNLQVMYEQITNRLKGNSVKVIPLYAKFACEMIQSNLSIEDIAKKYNKTNKQVKDSLRNTKHYLPKLYSLILS